MIRALLLTTLMVLTPSGDRCLDITLTPRFMVHLDTIRLQMHITRHADHRAYLVAWSSDKGSEGQSGPNSLAGDTGPTFYTLVLADQPPAHYVFQVQVFGRWGDCVATERREIVSLDEP